MSDAPAFNAGLSEAVAEGMRQPPSAKDCYLNAFNASSPLAERVGVDNLRYVEGVADGTPHAWLETTDGRIVEVTPIWRRKAGDVSYRAVERFDLDTVLDYLDAGGLFPITGRSNGN